MASHHGRDGIVKIGTDTIAEVKSWTLNQTAETTDATSLTNAQSNNNYRSFLQGFIAWDGTLECFWDETDTDGQTALKTALDGGTTVTLNLYPEGATSGDTYYSGSALVTGLNITGSFDDMVNASFTFTGSGELTTNTVA